MPLKINLGLSKKLGLPDYGSVGASCAVEFEVDGSLLQGDLDGFHARVRGAYVACRQAVCDELAQHQPAVSGASAGHVGSDAAPRASGGPSSGNGREANGHHNGNGGHRATQKQMGYIEQLARQIKGLGIRRLESLAQRMFSRPMAELSSLDASGLIDCLKSIKAGEIDLGAALNGAAHEH